MASETYKTLGQLNPAATTLSTLYTVPASTSTVCSSIIACNQSTATTFRIQVAVAAASSNVKQYIFFDAPLSANESQLYTLGITLAATDVVRVYSTSGFVSFNLFGCERT